MTDFLTRLDYLKFKSDSIVEQQAASIYSRKRKGDTRTLAQRKKNALDGCALEMAVYQELKSFEATNGWKVFKPSADKTFDIGLVLKNSRTIYLDVKGLFSASSRTITVSNWESKMARPETIYLIFQCAATANCIGWFQHKELLPSFRAPGTTYFTLINFEKQTYSVTIDYNVVSTIFEIVL